MANNFPKNISCPFTVAKLLNSEQHACYESDENHFSLI